MSVTALPRRSRRTASLPGGSPAAATKSGEPPVVLVGMDSATALQAARIMAARGVPVIGVARDPRHPCCRTRACSRIITADTAGDGLIEALTRLAPSLGCRAVLVPCTDLSVLLISKHRDVLSAGYRFALPPHDVVEMLVDKARFCEFAQQKGLPIPATFFVRARDEVLAAARSLRFPVVLKPAVKTEAWDRLAGAKAFRVSTAEELVLLSSRLAGLCDGLIVQEWIAGSDSDHYTCNCYFSAESEPLVTFTTRKLRQWPRFGGEACLSEESDNEAVIRETVRLFRTAAHQGLGYLELKQDARSGEYLIIEPNVGRPTGRSASAEAAGVELLYTLYCDLLGRPLPAQRQQLYRGAKWIHCRRDVQSALQQWWRGELTAAAWFHSLRGPKTDALFSWRDPVPFFADLVRVAFKAAPPDPN
jgi:D-aspartate ligase